MGLHVEKKKINMNDGLQQHTTSQVATLTRLENDVIEKLKFSAQHVQKSSHKCWGNTVLYVF